MRRTTRIIIVVAGMTSLVFGRQEIKCPAPDLSPEQSYVPISEIEGFENLDTAWAAADGSQSAKASVVVDKAVKRDGAASLRVDYEFLAEKKLEFIQLDTGIAVTDDDTPGGIGFWVLDDGTRFPLFVRLVDANGETHQLAAIAEQNSGWHFIAFSVSGQSSFWGGDKNGKLDLPAKLQLIFDRPMIGYKGKNSLWLDTVTRLKKTEQKRPSLVIEGAPPFGNVYAPKAQVELFARGEGSAIRWSVADYFDTIVAKGEGAASECPVTFTPSAPGYYRCRIDLISGGNVIETKLFPCAVLAATGVARNAFIGICTHFLNSHPLESMDLLAQYGIRHFRDEVPWSWTERTAGVYEMPEACGKYLARAKQLNMEPFVIYDYGNKLYAGGDFPNTDDDIAAFARYAAALTGMTKGNVTSYEVWNEWVGGCGMKGKVNDHSPEAYGRLQKAVYSAVKKEHPDVTVVGIGGEYGLKCAENIERAISTAGGSSMDAFSIHPYRYPAPPEMSKLVEEVGAIADRAAAKGAPKKAWVTEIGWPTQADSRGVLERSQARYIVRTYALLQSTGFVERVYWYDYKDDGTNRMYNEDNFGIVRHQVFNYAPKPAMVALSVFNRATAGATAVKLLRNENRHAVLYTLPDGSECLIAWMSSGREDATVSGTVSSVKNIMGLPISSDRSVRLTEDIVYIYGKDLGI